MDMSEFLKKNSRDLKSQRKRINLKESMKTGMNLNIVYTESFKLSLFQFFRNQSFTELKNVRERARCIIVFMYYCTIYTRSNFYLC